MIFRSLCVVITGKLAEINRVFVKFLTAKKVTVYWGRKVDEVDYSVLRSVIGKCYCF